MPRQIKLPRLEQGDLLFVELTGTVLKGKTTQMTKGKGWLLVNEVSINGEIINANFKPYDGPPAGYGNVLWPKYVPLAFLRGIHGECSPYAAIADMFNKAAATALT